MTHGYMQHCDKKMDQLVRRQSRMAVKVSVNFKDNRK